MPLYAGVCETNITPPPGVWMSGYALRPTGAAGVHDELYARALVLDDGHRRLAIIAADLISMPYDMAQRIRGAVATAIGTEIGAVMIHCTHTHGGPYLGTFRTMGESDDAYADVLGRKVVGAASQAAANLLPSHLTYGESSAQIGVNRRRSGPDGRIIGSVDYSGVVNPTVQALCVQGADGRTRAILFSHACHPTTMERDNLLFTGDWPGAAVAALKARFLKDGIENGIAGDALAFCLVGCCADINPVRRRTWDAVDGNGRQVAEAAHTARWNAHGRFEGKLAYEARTLELPLQPPPPDEVCERYLDQWERTLAKARDEGADRGRIMMAEGHIAWSRDCMEMNASQSCAATQSFEIQRLSLGAISIIGFPGEMFVQYALDFSAQASQPVMSLGCTNGCWNYVPTAAEFTRGGYEVDEAHKYYGTQMFTSECEPMIRDTVYDMLSVSNPDRTPYPLVGGAAG